MLILLCAPKRLSTSKTQSKDKWAHEDLLKPSLKNSAALCHHHIFTLQSSFSTWGWIRAGHRAVVSVTVSVNHRITGACGVLLCTLPHHPRGFIRPPFPAIPTALIKPQRGMEMAPEPEGPGHAEKPLKLQICPFKISTTGNSHQSSTRQNSCYQPTSRGHIKGAAPCCLSPPLFHSLTAFVWLFPEPSSLVSFWPPLPYATPPTLQWHSPKKSLTAW